tara:strand:- start:334 stop:495 length:162 start_codon:yes stop_codon:yes gene_type:complete
VDEIHDVGSAVNPSSIVTILQLSRGRARHVYLEKLQRDRGRKPGFWTAVERLY